MKHLGAWIEVLGLLRAPKWRISAALTVVFAAFGRAVGGVTNSGAVAGALVCFALLLGVGWGGFAALVTVFLLTWVATRIGYSRKQSLGTAESRRGRNGLQVLANIGVASGCAQVYSVVQDGRLLLCMGAALAEAAADTVSSEIGQAIGGTPRLITNATRVETGTDGAITALGSLVGTASAVLVGGSLLLTRVFGVREAIISSAAGIVGMFVDSLLGATLESRGVLRNNGVNLLSTAAAAAVALLIDHAL